MTVIIIIIIIIIIITKISVKTRKRVGGFLKKLKVEITK